MPTNQLARANDSRGLWFTHLTVEMWRNFSHIDVETARRVFLVGPNASGKSNLLDIFRFLHDIVAVGGGFQAAVERRGSVSRLRSLSARRTPDISVKVAVGNDELPQLWEYELTFGQAYRQQPVIRRETVRKQGSAVLSRPDSFDVADPARLSQTYLEQVNVNKDFREVAEFFRSIRYLHIVPQLIREPDRSVGRRDDPYGRDFLERVATTPEKTRDARLRRIRDALRIAVPQLRELELVRDVRGAPHLRGKYEHWRPQGAWQSEDQFSDGTLRLLGLLWAILDMTGPLLLEEPELSLHPEVVRYLPQMLARIQRRSGRQVLISTHSGDLLEDTGIGLDEVLLLTPGTEGTSVRAASDFNDIKALLDGGSSLADVVIPRTRPDKSDQLALFGG